MANLEELSQYVLANEHKRFLRCYLNLIAQGYNLSIPARLEVDQIREGWLEILPGVTGGYSDEFVEALSHYWLSIVEVQGAKLTPTFAQECLDIIEGKPKAAPVIPPAPLAQSAAASPKPKSAEAPAPGKSELPDISDRKPGPSLDKVESNISTSYYKDQTVREAPVLPKEVIEARMHEALESGYPELFLTHYLSLSRHNIKLKLPMSSVLPQIKTGWNDLLMDQFSYMADDEFLKVLTARWFFLVNHLGLPATITKQQECYFYQAAEMDEKKHTPMVSTKPQSAQFKKQKPLLKRLFHW